MKNPRRFQKFTFFLFLANFFLHVLTRVEIRLSGSVFFLGQDTTDAEDTAGSSDGDPNCQDTDGFADKYDNPCSAWVGYDCFDSDMAEQWYHQYAYTPM